ncbi:hypothetical protein COV19_05155 [Candidatus Woesearchaeota archaeon CG10_big_fil_rev_8_21_14_0_10_44_13]|nr:MAG: hypothetical protein COV19_05155 [Candidatus Woesearchaeota archaeon CG10_big_fil_rev_8_21_14_0_10_44_13]
MEIDEFLDKQIGKVKEIKSEDESGLPLEIREALEQKASQEAQLGAQPSKPEEAKAKPASPKEAGAGIPLPKRDVRLGLEDDIDSLIAQANAMISKGDFEGARQVYLRIKEVKEELPRRFSKQDEKVSESLINLNEKIADGFDRTLSTEFNEKFNRINSLLNEAYSYIQDNKISSMQSLSKVEDVYQHIKQLHMSFPEGYVEKRVMIEDQMLKLYKIIITNKKNLLYGDFTRKSDEIIRMMGVVADDIRNNNYQKASKLFSNVTKLYKELPKGFLKEKTDLQSQILDIYQKLVLGRETTAHTEFDDKSGQIRVLFSQAYELVKRDDMKGATGLYNQIAEIYSKLPAGYFSSKSEIEVEMMEFYHILSLKKDKNLLEETKAKVNQIDLLLQSARNYITHKETDFAKEVYGEIIDVYNSLPEGFFDEKVKVQNKIIRIYKDLLANLHEVIVSVETKSDKAKYDQLLSLLVDIHSHIMRKEFSDIKSKYISAYKIYHELPLGLIEEKKSLYTELYRVYEELRLYTTVDKLAELADNKQYKEMTDLLDRAAEEYNLLSKRYPQDAELFKYIQSKCLVYLDMLKRIKDEKKEMNGIDVRKKIERVAAAKEGLSGELPVQNPALDSAEDPAVQGQAKGSIMEKYGPEGMS